MHTLLDCDGLPASLPALLSLTDQELQSIPKHSAQGLLLKCVNEYPQLAAGGGSKAVAAERVSHLLGRLKDTRLDLVFPQGFDRLIGLSDTVMEERLEGHLEQGKWRDLAAFILESVSLTGPSLETMVAVLDCILDRDDPADVYAEMVKVMRPDLGMRPLPFQARLYF